MVPVVLTSNCDKYYGIYSLDFLRTVSNKVIREIVQVYEIFYGIFYGINAFIDRAYWLLLCTHCSDVGEKGTHL